MNSQLGDYGMHGTRIRDAWGGDIVVQCCNFLYCVYTLPVRMGTFYDIYVVFCVFSAIYVVRVYVSHI